MFFFSLDLLQDEEGRCPKCSKHLEELESVKEEFERYKLRAQSVLKNKNSKVKYANNSRIIDSELRVC